MHISDGILNGTVCITAAAAAAAVTSVALKKTDTDDIPKISVMTAAFFVASLVHFKLGPTSTHLVLNGLIGIILGISSFPAILVALFFQAVMFQHGGLTTLGVNSITMGLPAILAYGIFQLHRFNKSNILLMAVSFLGGFSSVILSGIGVYLFLKSTGKDFLQLSKLVLGIHLPLALVEGAITAFAVSFLNKVKPDLLRISRVRENSPPR
jgi:cobalt/nickel transport system permease protein